MASYDEANLTKMVQAINHSQLSIVNEIFETPKLFSLAFRMLFFSIVVRKLTQKELYL
jgi:hypothetical protein